MHHPIITNLNNLDLNTSDQIKGFKPAVLKWGELIDVYIATVGDHLPFEFGERALVSLLSSAVWKSGGISIAEYGEEKFRGGNEALENEMYIGASDLFAQSDNYKLNMEAKYSNLSLKPNRKWKHIFDQNLKKADASSSELIPRVPNQDFSFNKQINQSDNIVVSLLFHSYYITKKNIDNYEGLKQKIIEETKKNNSLNLSSFYFLEQPWQAHNLNYITNNKYECGVSMHMSVFAEMGKTPCR